MSRIVLLFILILFCFNPSFSQSNVGLKLDLGAIHSNGSSINGEDPSFWRSNNAVLGIHYGVGISYNLSLVIGANLNSITSYSSFSFQEINKDIHIVCIGPSLDLQYWFKGVQQTGFFLDLGVSVPITIKADELIYEKEFIRFRTLEENDFIDRTQKIFPYVTLGVGGRWNITRKLGVELVLSASAYNNVVDTAYDQNINFYRYLSLRAFYSLSEKEI